LQGEAHLDVTAQQLAPALAHGLAKQAYRL
jgi:hypothetical protein